MSWKVATGLGLMAVESVAILCLCIPKATKRIGGPWLIAAGIVGCILGTVFVAPPGFTGRSPEPLFPFDPNDEASCSVMGAEWTLVADLGVGVGFPFVLLALAGFTKKNKGNGS